MSNAEDWKDTFFKEVVRKGELPVDDPVRHLVAVLVADNRGGLLIKPTPAEAYPIKVEHAANNRLRYLANLNGHFRVPD